MCAHTRVLRKGFRLRGKGICCILESDPRFALLLVSIVDNSQKGSTDGLQSGRPESPLTPVTPLSHMPFVESWIVRGLCISFVGLLGLLFDHKDHHNFDMYV